ncbi:hypothetical protein V512_011290 [Mesotoga sp. Brook.08.105.5.1]|nr:hypothetical protein RJ60_05660 [Mesotoga sp. B105.6.4]PVD17484.1 hypothetical protein V512_011290 [Mesotoga sp. Brook.08.105.5.1]
MEEREKSSSSFRRFASRFLVSLLELRLGYGKGMARAERAGRGRERERKRKIGTDSIFRNKSGSSFIT